MNLQLCRLVDYPECSIIYKIDKSKGLEVYVDAHFAGGWSAADSENADNVLSRTNFVIVTLTVPLFGAASFRPKIALFTAEAEYIAMSHAFCETIPIKVL